MNEKEKNNDKFILEYPENYEEICQIALRRLDKDYTNVVNSKNVKESKGEEEENEEIEEENRNYVQLEEDDDDSNFQREEDIKEKEPITEEKPKKEDVTKKEIVIKDPNRLKQMLSKVKFPAPKWGENLSDKDFIDKVKDIYFNDSNIK